MSAIVAGVERVFSHDEATALLPRLNELLSRLQRAYRSLLSEPQPTATHHASSNGSATAAMAASESEREVSEVLSDIESLGVIVRDAETGLVDFAAYREGEAIYLCWRLGEDEIGFWHQRDTGFMGRQPL